MGDARQLIGFAELARVRARQSKLGTSAINHATVIKIRAERSLANIVDEGQKRGEIATDGRPETVRTPDSFDYHGECPATRNCPSQGGPLPDHCSLCPKLRAIYEAIDSEESFIPATLPSIGVDRQRLAEARLLRDSYTDDELRERQAEANEWVSRIGGVVRLAIPERREAAAELSEEGMTTREIGAALGVDYSTIARDLDAVANATEHTPSATTVEDSAVANATNAPHVVPTPIRDLKAQAATEEAE